MANPSSRRVHLSPPTKKFIATLDKQGKLDFQTALVHIGTSANGEPDTPLGFPYHPNARCLSFRGFWIVYRIMDDESIRIGSADFIPDL